MNETRLEQLPLQFGLFDWIEWEDRRPASDIFEERLQMLEYADRAGFFCYHLAEHHITPLSLAPSPGLFLAAAAQRTHRIRLGPLVYLLPFYNPLRLVQEICMLDHLCQGRLELGVGRGIVPMEAEKFHVKEEESWDMFREALDLLLTAFTSDLLNFEGTYYSYKDIRLWMRPMQQPYPPLWYASGNINTVPWMAQQGLNTAHGLEPAAATKPHFDLYKQLWQEHRDNPKRLNNHVKTPKLGLIRHVYAAPSDAQAEQECRAAFKAWFYNINFLWAQAGSNRLDFISNFDKLLDTGVLIAGSPQTVRERVEREVNESGINYFCSIFAFGDLSHAQVMASMRLFVQEVMPAFIHHAA
ncbi:MAG: LLM class flavin-dependent oxidoreductase [Nitrospinae bacterium]|nr:LLM class flavin-dependent oxidoreductase [Nitrospinota bacterium]